MSDKASFSSLRTLHSGGFKSFLATQFLGAFNDNVFKLLIICYALNHLSDSAGKSYIPLASGVFILPYLLFSGYAGYLADRYSKRLVMIGTKWLEVAVMLLGLWLFWLKATYWLLPVLFLMGAQSAFFSPAKYGFLPEVLLESHLPRGNGATQLFTFLAIVLGGWAGGELSQNFQLAPHFAAAVCVAVAVLGVVSSYGITATKAGDRSVRFHFDPITPHLRTLLETRQDQILLLSFLGNTFFWFLGVLFQSNLAMLVKSEMAGTDRLVGFFQGAVALGIGLGSLLCGFSLRGKINSRFVLPAGLTMAALSIALGLSVKSIWLSLAVTGLLGASSGFYQLPLNTILQQRSPNHKRGRYLAAMNALDCVSMLAASAFHWLLLNPCNMQPSNVFVTAGIMTVIVVIALHLAMKKQNWRETANVKPNIHT